MTTRRAPLSNPHPIVRRTIFVGLAGSALLHLFMFFAISRPPPTPVATTLKVDLLPSISQQELNNRQQMVSPPAPAPEPSVESPTKLKPFLSDQDNVAPKESIKRGQDDAGPRVGPPAKQPPARQATKPQPESQNQPKGQPLKTLKLDSSTMLREFTNRPADNNPLASLPKTAPFSRPSGSGARFLGMTGSSDFLPNLPDGDLTLLNTKANLHAVFVRRVATQVFSELRQQGWESLAAHQVTQISDFCTVRAIMSPTGKLESAEIIGASGSPMFDGIVLRAARTATRDQNPPKAAAAADGKIYFIFKSKSWSQLMPDSRRGLVSERRWLLLGTGLD